MTDPIIDPITGAVQVTNPQTQTPETHQDIFWWSSDIFNNPDMFQAVPETAPKAEEDFHLDLGQLQANQQNNNEYSASEKQFSTKEPEIIEPQVQETFEEYQARQNPPQPEIIEQFVEPQMKPEVKVNPRRQWTTNNEQLTVPKPQQPKPQPAPQPRPQIQAVAKPVQAPVQARPQVQIPPRPVAPVTPKPQPAPQPRPQVQAVAKPVQAPVQVVRPPEITPEPVVAPVVERVETTPQATTSDLQKKLAELINTAKNIYALEKKQEDEVVELLWANNDKVTILYQITLPENGISIKKIEKDIETDEENINDLWFILDTENTSLQVILDDVLLLDEVEDLIDDAKKKMQVTEKLNKFIFLLSEQEKKIAKEAKEKEEAEQERRRLQDIFRNF